MNVRTFAAVARAMRDAKGTWVPTLVLYEMFGRDVYPICRRLYKDGLLERHEEDGGPERGNRPRVYYRWQAKHHDA